MTIMKRQSAIAAFCAALVLGTAGCGAAPSGTSASSAADTDERLMKLQQSILGSSAEQSAKAFLDNYALDAPIKSCMAESDLPYQIEYSDVFVGARPLSLGDTWTEPILDDSVIVNIQVAAEKSAMEAQLYAPLAADAIERTPAYHEALQECEKAAGGVEDPQGVPRVAEQVAFQLDTLLTDIESQVGSAKSYDTCMADAGFDVVRDDFDGVTGMHLLLNEKAPALDKVPYLGDDQITASWREYESFSATVLDADQHCRLDEHIEAMGLVSDALDSFVADNGKQIAEIRQEWARIMEEASAKGWVDESNTYVTSK